MYNYEKFITYLLFIFLGIYFISVILTNGYPHNNDILHVLKIAALDGKLKFINGAYLPGYTYYTILFSDSLNVLTFFICFLIIISSLLLMKLIKIISFNQPNDVKLYLSIFSILIHFIIIITVGLNYTDTIFILLFYNGLLFFLYGYYFKSNKFYYFFGCLIIGISLLFRHHGLVAIFLLYINFIFFEIYHLKKNFKLSYKKFLSISFIILLPFVLSQIHLMTIDAVAEWQTSLKLNFFVYGHTWGDWRDIKFILNSDQSKNFNILDVDKTYLAYLILDHIKGTLIKIYPFIIFFLISFFICRKKIIIITLILFLIYLLLISPGYGRGYYPALFFCFLPIFVCYNESSQYKKINILAFILIFGHLIYISERYLENTFKSYYVNKDIKENVVPLLKSKKIEYKNIFSDDYDFYTNKLNGDINRICNWGGWLLAHPYYEDYYPHDVILGKKNTYCKVKVLITRDKEFADKYKNNPFYKKIYKTKKFYILTTM